MLRMLALGALCLGCAAAPAQTPLVGTVLFDFEGDADLAAWHDEGKATLGADKTLTRVERFATLGRSALCFSTPAWKEGRNRWPAVEVTPPFTDWTGYDRLVFDLTNATGLQQKLSLFITDSTVATRSGLHRATSLPPFSYAQVVVELDQLAEKKVAPADISTLHFYTSDPPGDMVVYLDRVLLLKKGEPLPAVPPEYLRDFAGLQARLVTELRAQLAAAQARLEPTTATQPKLTDWWQRELAAAAQKITDFEAALERAEPGVLEAARDSQRLQGQLARIESIAALRVAMAALPKSAQAPDTPPPRDDLAVGFASSMVKVLPREMPLELSASASVQVSLARNEKESFQVIVVPCDKDVQRVHVRVGDLRAPDGAVFAAANIKAPPVGYVRTQSVPPYGSAHVGWWPDPILDFMDAADIAKGDAQAFWVRVRAPKTQPAGTYTGKLEIVVDGAPAAAFDLSVRVYAFELPDRSPLPMAITFAPHDHTLPATKAEQTEWRKSEDYPVKAWRRHRIEWGEFLADYYITFDSLYHRAQPDFEILTRLRDQGRLDMFNLGYYGPVGDETAAAIEKWKTDHLPRLRAAYAKAKELGLLEHAYIYGCDEAPEKLFGTVQKAAEILKQEFPGVLIMTTTYDHSFGLDSVIKAMDAFCPLTPRFDPAKAQAARALGKQVWWYICCGPHHPCANMFVEYPAIEGRVLMGATTAKFRPDGFLYYQISIWNAQKPITSGPFTDWDPRSWTTYHGDGAWTCVGPDGTPLATVRLENFRDGIEDYAYYRALETRVAKVEADEALRAARADWLAQAKPLLQVPDDVVKSIKEYTRDPEVVLRYRTQLAEAIEAAELP